MKILVTGDREWTSSEIILEAIRSHMPCTIVHGGARGADSIAEKMCELLGVEYISYPADWNKYGRSAGPIRNRQMLIEEEPELVLAFHNDIFSSKGTKDMCKQALKRNLPVRLYSGKWRGGRYISLNDLDYDRKDPNLF